MRKKFFKYWTVCALCGPARFFSVALIAILAVHSSFRLATAQSESNTATESPSVSGSFEQSVAEARAAFAKQIEALAGDSEQSGRVQEMAVARQLLKLTRDRDPYRQYIFLPESGWQYRDGLDPEFLSKLDEARIVYANQLVHLAKVHVGDGPGAPVWQNLHEALAWNPDMEEVRGFLGHGGQAGNWQVLGEKLLVRKGTRNHPIMNWRSGEWIEVNTEHFVISSIADEPATLRLARQAERWRWIWQQVFFDFWNDSDRLARTLAGTTPKRNSRRFEIVLFPDEASYVEQLRQRVPGVEHSKGYYSDQQKVSFFFASQDKAVESTWRHELTHQFFQESVRAKPGVFDDGYLWLGEGIAMYMESLQDFGNHVTLGGFDASRLQFARIRKLREKYYVPLSEISPLSLARFQARPDVRNLYSQSAGITQMLMTADNGAYRNGLIDFLRLLYAGKLKDDAFEKNIGAAQEEIDQRYPDFLAIRDRQVRDFLLKPESVTELALPAAKLDDDSFKAIGRCQNLMWLDLTGTELNSSGMDRLAECDQLLQLFLSQAVIHDGALSGIQNLGSIEELDLSYSSLTDHQLAEIEGCTTLTGLSLTSTPITDASIPVLCRLKSLRSISLKGTPITPAGIQQLQNANPNLTVR